MAIDPYAELFQQYVGELQHVYDRALSWWAALIQAEDRHDASIGERAVEERWPCGPVSHPLVIAVFRKYFLLCCELNDELIKADVNNEDVDKDIGNEGYWGSLEKEEEEEVLFQEPRFVLMERLEQEYPELGLFVNGLVFSPIGVDQVGKSA